MGCVMKLVDAIVFLFLLLKATGGPLFDALFCIPQQYHPKFLVHVSSRYVSEFGDYFVSEKPEFYVGLAWMELCVLWPLSIVNLYGLVCRKSWFRSTCLIHGVCLTTMMVAIISELRSSGKATDKTKMVYYIFIGLCMLLALRGILSSFCGSPTVSKEPLSAARKKRA